MNCRSFTGVIGAAPRGQGCVLLGNGRLLPALTRVMHLYRSRSFDIVRRSSFSDEDQPDVDSAFFYDDACDTSTDHLTKEWRTYRALLVASENSGLMVSQSKREELRKMMKVSQVSGALGKHTGRGLGGSVSGSVWSHTITHPERGCLLVAKRPDLGMFSYSVVLMTEHDDEIGSSGLVLNMATPLHVSNLGLEDHICESLGKLPLYIGGPVTRNLLHVLHGVEKVQGSMEIVPGVFAGGVESAADLVLRGEIDPIEFRLLAGYSSWEPYQLSEEIRHGAWHVISASSDVILGCVKGDFSAFSGGYDGLYDDHGENHLGVDNRKLDCWKAILSETIFGE
jgi:putative transcriptional regulator